MWKGVITTSLRFNRNPIRRVGKNWINEKAIRRPWWLLRYSYIIFSKQQKLGSCLHFLNNLCLTKSSSCQDDLLCMCLIRHLLKMTLWNKSVMNQYYKWYVNLQNIQILHLLLFTSSHMISLCCASIICTVWENNSSQAYNKSLILHAWDNLIVITAKNMREYWFPLTGH